MTCNVHLDRMQLVMVHIALWCRFSSSAQDVGSQILPLKPAHLSLLTNRKYLQVVIVGCARQHHFVSAAQQFDLRITVDSVTQCM